MNDKVLMRDGDAILVMVQGGKVMHYSWNMGLPHVEFVRRKTGTEILPEGAWIGTGAIILANVGKGTVVAAGSVVTKPLPDNVPFLSQL